LFGAVGLLFFGPLAFGAVEPWSIYIIETGSALLFATWAIRQLSSGTPSLTGNPTFLPMMAFGALIFLQLATRQTAYPAATVSQALLYCAYGLLCFLVVQCLHRTSQIKTVAVAFSAYGFAVATFALLQGIASNGKLYWLRTPRFGGWIYGPYVNHNHYAGLMEMLTPVPLVLCLSRRVRRQHRVAAALAAAIMASTIFISGSRGGMLAFAVQLALLATVLLGRQRNGRTALALGAVLVIALGLLAWIGGGELASRMASIPGETRAELSGGMRLSIDRDCLKMLVERPILGWGLGVFPDVYPQFRSFYTNVQVDKAHNDYLQMLVDMGGLGFIVLLWFLASVYGAAIKRLRTPRADINTDMTLAAVLGVTGIVVHSFVDFNLQIPANAAFFYVLCVVAAMNADFRLQRSKQRRKLDQTSGWYPAVERS
jgi:O-antigen ligase